MLIGCWKICSGYVEGINIIGNYKKVAHEYKKVNLVVYNLIQTQKMQPAAKFVHAETRNQSKAPYAIAPLVLQFITPASVVDIGCGTGNFLKAFKTFGVNKVLGVDGSWADKKLVAANLDKGEFIEADLEHFDHKLLGNKFDLALCLEVAEHLAPAAADGLVKNLTQLSNTILFSAAIPGQGGYKHINEQWATYWQAKFAQHDFYFWDIMRPQIANHPDVPFWFQQNLFLVAHKDHPPQFDANSFNFQSCANYVHPDVYLKQVKRLHDLKSGNYSIKGYVKLLAKAVRRKARL